MQLNSFSFSKKSSNIQESAKKTVKHTLKYLTYWAEHNGAWLKLLLTWASAAFIKYLLMFVNIKERSSSVLLGCCEFLVDLGDLQLFVWDVWAGSGPLQKAGWINLMPAAVKNRRSLKLGEYVLCTRAFCKYKLEWSKRAFLKLNCYLMKTLLVADYSV